MHACMHAWRGGRYTEVLAPETNYEGAALPVQESACGAVYTAVHQLRDPFVLEDTDGAHELYMYYSGSGEKNICVTKVHPH